MTDQPQTTTPGTAPDKSGQTTSGQQNNSGDPQWIFERLEQKERSVTAKILREVGVDTLESLNALVKAAKEAESSKKTALEKAADEATQLQTRLATAEQKAAEAEAKVTALEQARVNDRIDGVIRKAADKATYPDDIVDWARHKSGMDLQKVFKADGSTDEKFVNDLITAVQQARPDWFKGTGVGSPSNKGGKPPAPDVNKALGDRPLVRF